MDTCFDRMFYSEGRLLGGVDESGVVDIAGPLVAACVILPRIDLARDDLKIFQVDDSKKIAEKYRKGLAEIIWSTAIGIGIGEVSPAEVDYLSKPSAIGLAGLRAIMACKSPSTGAPIRPNFLLLDGRVRVPIRIKQARIRDGDGKSLCVASASIIAKVYRDEIMLKLHEAFPYYAWNTNKGHPRDPRHLDGLDRYGVQPGIHRLRHWPFMQEPSYKRADIPEAERAHWRERRQRWHKVTVARMAKEISPQHWTLNPPLWKPSPDCNWHPQEGENSGESTSP
jgi:ribonuclease HII